MKKVLIVGGVAGGASCAARLRRLDEHAQIIVFERGPDASFANCGLPYYLGGVIANRQNLLVAGPARFRDWLNVDVRTMHEVRRIDRAAKTIEVADLRSGEVATHAYDALVLSPGAAPVVPPIPGVDLPGVFTLRNLVDTDAILAAMAGRQRAAVVGGGFIGLELAENFQRRGMTVTVFERLPQAMPPMDPEMTRPIAAELAKKGVVLKLNQSVTAIERSDEGLAVVTSEGRLVVDMVVLGVGVRPDVALAKEAGLELGVTGGIRVDDQMRTSDSSIFAVGDAIEVLHTVTGEPTLVPLAGPANRQGRIAADVICGRPSRYRGTQGTAVCGIFDLTLAMTGASEKTLRRLGIAYEKSYTHGFDHATYYPGAEAISMKLLFSPSDGRVLGAQAVGGTGAAKRIDVIAALMQKDATVFDLEEAELCYAPQYGSAKDPVNMAGFVAGNLLRGDVVVAHWADWHAAETKPMVLDVRTPGEYAAGHVPNAINVQLGELRKRLGELPRDREIWVHCGVGQRSYYAVRILMQNGFRVRNLSGGFRSFQS